MDFSRHQNGIFYCLTKYTVKLLFLVVFFICSPDKANSANGPLLKSFLGSKQHKSSHQYTTNKNSTNQQADELPYLDDAFKCMDRQLAQSYINDFKIDFNSFGGFELCNSKVDTKKLLNDLFIVQNTNFSGNTKNPLIGDIVPANQYYSWLKSQTRGIERGNDIPYATAYNSGGYFTMQDGWAKLTTLGRVGTVIHEARHTAGFRHYPCLQGSYKDARTNACDESFSQKGSHAVEMEYYARIHFNSTNIHPVYKSMARLMAMARANFLFNKPIIRPRESLFGISNKSSNENLAYLLNNSQWIERLVPQIQGVLKRTSFGASLVNSEQVAALDLYDRTSSLVIKQDTYSYYKLLQLGNLTAELLDFEEFDLGNKRYVVAITSNNETFIYNFPEGKWRRPFMFPSNFIRSSTTLESGRRGYFAIDQTNAIYELNPENFSWTKTQEKWNPQVVSIVLNANKILALNTDGHLYEITKSGYFPWENQIRFSQIVNVPMYDAFEVIK